MEPGFLLSFFAYAACSTGFVLGLIGIMHFHR